MKMLHFHMLRAAVQANASPGSGSDLATMEGNLRDLLLDSGMFETVEVEHTDDPDQLVVALCQFRPDYDERDVAGYVERVWDDGLRYPFWEAHSLLVDDEHVELQGATRVSQSGHYATVHLVAQKARIPAQRVPVD